MAYFACRADACSGVKRKDFKYLDGARVVPLDTDECSFLVNFSDSTVHRLSVVNDGDDTQQISRQVLYPNVSRFKHLFKFSPFLEVAECCARARCL